jgi:hypothetical protein
MAASSASFDGYRPCTVTHVLPPLSSKVIVVMAPSALSSLVQERREYDVTLRYLPQNAMGSGSVANTSRCPPPADTNVHLAGKQGQSR